MKLNSQEKKQEKGSADENINRVLEECEKYRSQLVKYCLKFFDCDYECAEDCVQNAYVALLENLKNGVIIKNYKAWLYTVVLNYKNKAIKEIQSRNEYDFADNEEKDTVLNNSVIYEPDFSESIVSDEMIEEQAIKIIASLKPEEQRLYIEYYLQNKKLKDIAGSLGVSFDAVRKRHTALKKKLRKIIDNCYNNG